MASPRKLPKDVQVMASILKEVGVDEYEPRVLNQMLEFMHRYVRKILEDARSFSLHAKKPLDVDDVKLAINLHTGSHFTPLPPRELLSEISRQVNGTVLPVIKSNVGLRIPPDRYNLTACNYRLRANKKMKTCSATPRMSMSSQANHPANKTTSGLLTTKNNVPSFVTKAAATSTATGLPKIQVTPLNVKVSEGNRSTALPRIKVTPLNVKAPGDNPSSAPASSAATRITSSPSVPISRLSSQGIVPSVIVTTQPLAPTSQGEKRKWEDVEDFDFDF